MIDRLVYWLAVSLMSWFMCIAVLYGIIVTIELYRVAVRCLIGG